MRVTVNNRRPAQVRAAHLLLLICLMLAVSPASAASDGAPEKAGGEKAVPATAQKNEPGKEKIEPAPTEFTLKQVVEQARNLAAEPYQQPERNIPDWLADISFEQWQAITFNPDSALWRGDKLPFHVQFFHPGVYYDRSVRINIIADGQAMPARFAPAQFNYGNTDFGERVPDDLGYAGFRIHYALNEDTPEEAEPVAIFLGASYFRAIGRNQAFGLSARGLAIDTGLPSGEEFPYFREFWLQRPEPDAQQMTVYALLDSPSITGAYRFVIQPGEETLISVETKLFRREAITKLGIAPLTSMFLFGENHIRYVDDFRPEVHDSDGLVVHSGNGEWVWRPLVNPPALQINRLVVENPRGFGLVQRDREFGNYQDLEAHYERRPSVWVAPRGDWGKGHVEVVQIPSDREENENIVAFWVPEKLPEDLKTPLHYVYDLHWFLDKAEMPPGGQVVATRRESGEAERAKRFVIDFAGGALTKLPADANVQGVVNVNPGWKLLSNRVLKNPITGGWRLIAVVQPEGEEPLEVRAFLQHGDSALTETWTYTVNP